MVPVTSSASDVFMARQPIYGPTQVLEAYELLYRSGERNHADVVSVGEAAQAIVNSLIDIGLGRLTEDTIAFINVDQSLLTSGILDMLPANRVVLEILETVEATPENVDAVRSLHEAGYTLALDDYVTGPSTKPFLPYVDIVKFDVLALGGMLLKEVQHVQRPGLKLLAEKVETRAQFEMCKKMGFDLYQGYFFSHPEIIKGRSIPPDRLAALKVSARLQSPDLSLNELEAIVGADLALSHRLLRLVKSASVGVLGCVDSVRQAIMFLGLKTVAALATLLAMSASSTKPRELLVTAFVRAKMCESLALARKLPNKDRYFTLGLFSVIDVLLDAPMRDVLVQLPLGEEMDSALIDHETENSLADILRAVLAFEQGAWHLIQLDMSLSDVIAAYIEAVSWAHDRKAALDPAA